MADDSKSFERKLDRDFLYYLNLIKTLYDKVTVATDKQLCGVWLTHLVGKNYSTAREKCDRNIFLSRLLLQMQNGKLQGIFQETPPDTLPCAFTTFGLPSEIDDLRGFEDLGFQLNKTIAGGSGDYSESSKDGRTYLATRHLPDGIMAYLAVTNNEGEKLWQSQGNAPGTSSSKAKPWSGLSDFVKKLMANVSVPINFVRTSPEDVSSALEEIDKTIKNITLWLQGTDPHDPLVETLFESSYNDFLNCPETHNLFRYPKKVRTVIMKFLRKVLTEKREELISSLLSLDQYESDQYFEERIPGRELDEVWLQCAKKPMSTTTKANLEMLYPPEVIDRFFELLYQERIHIIEKGEKEAARKISELRSGSLDDIKKELQKLKKLKQDYKEYYDAYVDIEAKTIEFEKEVKEKCAKTGKSSSGTDKSDKLRQEMENQIEQHKKTYEKERKLQQELKEKLLEVKQCLHKSQQRMKAAETKWNCEKEQIAIKTEEITQAIIQLKERQCELTHQINEKTRHRPPEENCAQ